MNVVSLAMGVLLVGFGFVTLIHRLHDRTVHESLAVLKWGRSGAARTVPFLSAMAPVVSSIMAGVALLVVALLNARTALF